MRYLELPADAGLAPSHVRDPKTGLDIPNPKAGEPEALHEIGVNIPVPTKIQGDEVVMVTRRAEITPGPDLDKTTRARIIPGSRIVETDHPAVASLLLDVGYVEIDKPTIKPKGA